MNYLQFGSQLYFNALKALKGLSALNARALNKALLSLPLLLLFSGSSFATSLVKLDLAGLIADSSWIVQGKVLSVTEESPQSEKASPYTHIEIQISQIYSHANLEDEKGANDGEGGPWLPPQTLTLSYVGGPLGNGLALQVPGTPKFKVGDEAIFFLEEAYGGLTTVGLGQGAWRIYDGPMGYPLTKQDIGAASLFEANGSGALSPAENPLPSIESLDRFENKLKRLLEGRP